MVRRVRPARICLLVRLVLGWALFLASLKQVRPAFHRFAAEVRLSFLLTFASVKAVERCAMIKLEHEFSKHEFC